MKCNKCDEEIMKQKERYVCIENYELGKSIRKTWFHLLCWNESINLNLQAKNMLDKLTPMVNLMTGKEEVYDIK